MRFYLSFLSCPLLLCVCTEIALAAVPSIPFTVSMSKPVTIGSCTGVSCPFLTLSIGGNTRAAYCPAVSNSSTLTCTYTATPGDVDLDGISFVDTNLHDNGISIADQSGNPLTNFAFTPPANISAVKVNYPSLSMDFTYDADGRYTLNGAVHNDLTSFLSASSGSFARSSVGTYFDSTGTLQTAAANVPRFDYDPVSHTAKGILIEETRTNLLTYSEQFDNASWTKSASSITPNATVAPDGTMTADKLVENSATVYHPVTRTTTVTAATPYTYSVYLKAAERTFAQVRYENSGSTQLYAISVNLSNGTYTPITFGAPVGTSATVTNVGNGWYRCAITVTSNNTGFKTLIYPEQASITYNYTGDGTSGVYIWGAQLEAGAFSTSSIQTTSAAALRASDKLTIPIASWFNPSQGGIYSSAFFKDLASGQHALAAFTGTSDYNVGYGFLLRSSSATAYAAGGYCCSASLVAAHSVNTLAKAAAAYSGATSIVAANNTSTTTTNNDFTGSGTTQLFLGGLHPSTSWQSIGSGNISTFKYYPLAPESTQLQLMTQ